MTSVKVNIKPTSEIIAKLGIQPNGPAHTYFTEKCAEHMDKYVPYREGNLAYANMYTTTDEVHYASRYAQYMYEGKVMGPNIPIKDANGNIVKWFSRKPKYLTDRDIDYSQSRANPEHEFAGPHWDKRMWSAEKDEVVKEVAEYVKIYGGK